MVMYKAKYKNDCEHTDKNITFTQVKRQCRLPEQIDANVYFR